MTPTWTLSLDPAGLDELVEPAEVEPPDELPHALSATRLVSASSAPPVIRTRGLTVVLSMGSCRRRHELVSRQWRG
jgi:hypothetical protein